MKEPSNAAARPRPRPAPGGSAAGVGAVDLSPFIAPIRWPEEDEEFRFEVLSEANAASVNDFYTEAFGASRSPEAFRWKFFGSPEGRALGMIAIEKASGRVVASAAGRPRRLWIEGREIRAVQVFETATAPDLHRLLLFRSVVGGFAMQACEAGMPLSFGGKIGSRALAVGRRVFGFRVYVSLRTWELRLSLRVGVQRRLGALAAPFVWVADRLQRSPFGSVGARFDFERVAEFGAEVDELWQRLRDRYRVACVRESAVLNHRYRDCPVGEHRLWLARRDGRLDGFIVYRIWEREGVRLATVLDHLDGHDPEVAAALLTKAAQDASESGCDFLQVASAESTALDAAAAGFQGFQVSEREPVDHVAGNLFPFDDPTDPELAFLASAFEPRNWHYTQGDSDFHD